MSGPTGTNVNDVSFVLIRETLTTPVRSTRIPSSDRRVERKKYGTSHRAGNSFLQVLLKLIPSEVIAVYVFIQGVLPGRFWPHFAFALLLVGLTPLYLAKAAG